MNDKSICRIEHCEGRGYKYDYCHVHKQILVNGNKCTGAIIPFKVNKNALPLGFNGTWQDIEKADARG